MSYPSRSESSAHPSTVAADGSPAPNEPSEDELWDRVVYGPPERCIAQVRRDVEMGFTDFIGWFDVGGLPIETVERSMRRFAAEVTPAVAGATAGVGAAG